MKPQTTRERMEYVYGVTAVGLFYLTLAAMAGAALITVVIILFQLAGPVFWWVVAALAKLAGLAFAALERLIEWPYT
jgi:hypothetical protein